MPCALEVFDLEAQYPHDESYTPWSSMMLVQEGCGLCSEVRGDEEGPDFGAEGAIQAARVTRRGHFTNQHADLGTEPSILKPRRDHRAIPVAKGYVQRTPPHTSPREAVGANR
jgi:hypothetical protein|mmetsp:Transcript_4032/g.13478  ORF Transcript_4032/g.13478 Transcript_4032/m.13478 type:complete len:113 (+) Transcript_4032:1472-1810(+)